MLNSRVSVIIPTYNRGSSLVATLEHILASNRCGLDGLEVVVVDDGSSQPAAPWVDALQVPDGVSLRCIRQSNAGPAAARNRGFRASDGEIVLFVDDDILCPPRLVRQHVEAHRARPGSAIVGRCPFAGGGKPTSFRRFVDSLGHDVGRNASEALLPITVLASGQISFERSMFEPAGGVYRDDLATPAAEEYELSLRLRDRGIPILLATEIAALHDHPVELRSMCRQALKHGMGAAEVAIKCPRTMELPELRTIIHHNGYLTEKGASSAVTNDALKRLFAAAPFRQGLLAAGLGCERLFPSVRLLYPLYRTLLGANFRCGIQAGFRRFPLEDEARRGGEPKEVSAKTGSEVANS